MTESRGNDGELRDWAWYKPERGRRCDRKKCRLKPKSSGFRRHWHIRSLELRFDGEIVAPARRGKALDAGVGVVVDAVDRAELADAA